jgi:hypothetical protein
MNNAKSHNDNMIYNVALSGMKQKRKRQRLLRIRLAVFFICCFLLIILILLIHKIDSSEAVPVTIYDYTESSVYENTDTDSSDAADLPNSDSGTKNDAEADIEQYAASHGYTLSDYPDNLIELYKKNPDAREFVLEYPEKKNSSYDINLSEYNDCTTVPLLMQWDYRWGYDTYSGDLFALTGCGPTCLSMAAIYLTGDAAMNPKWMADYATAHGYSVDGSGSSWTLISEGASLLGLSVRELPLSESSMNQAISQGHIIICIMGPGDFTDSGHFIVITGCSSGGFIVNDPNSYTNSSKVWSYDEIYGQIKDLWELWK